MCSIKSYTVKNKNQAETNHLFKHLRSALKVHPFLFSRTFFLWALLGILGGIISGVYWIAFEFLTHGLALFDGWQVIPAMAVTGFLTKSENRKIDMPQPIVIIKRI